MGINFSSVVKFTNDNSKQFHSENLTLIYPKENSLQASYNSVSGECGRVLNAYSSVTTAGSLDITSGEEEYASGGISTNIKAEAIFSASENINTNTYVIARGKTFQVVRVKTPQYAGKSHIEATLSESDKEFV